MEEKWLIMIKNVETYLNTGKLPDGITENELANWLNEQYNNESLSIYERKKLEFLITFCLTDSDTKLKNKLLIKFCDILGLDKFEKTWMDNYKKLKKYKEENGHVLLSCLDKYEGVNLGAWLYRQRVAKLNNNLSKEYEDLLLELGVILGTWNDGGWEYKYNYAKEYYEENGNLKVPVGYRVGGFNLSSWLLFQNQKNLKGELTEDRVNLLNDIGMHWSKTYKDKWMEKYQIAKKYYIENGHLNTKRNEAYEGINLDAWLNNQRRARSGEKHRRIYDWQVDLLDELNMKWSSSAKSCIIKSDTKDKEDEITNERLWKKKRNELKQEVQEMNKNIN